MTTRPGRNAPTAIPYDVMPAYRAARDLWQGLAVLRDRLPDERQGHLPAGLGFDALVRMARQAITIAAGAISEREEKEDLDP